MACTHTQINVQKTHTHRCHRSPAIKRSLPAPRGSGCVSGPWQTNSCWTHRSRFSPTVDRSSYLWETSISPSWYRSANPVVGERRVCLPETRHQNTPRHIIMWLFCRQWSGTVIWLQLHRKKTSSICSVLMHGWLLHLFAFYFSLWLGVSLVFYSCGWHWRMIFESRAMYRDEQHVLSLNWNLITLMSLKKKTLVFCGIEKKLPYRKSKLLMDEHVFHII